MKNLLLTILISSVGITASFAADDLAVNPVSSAPQVTGSIQVATATVATNTATTSINEEVDANYSEIVGLRDCTLLKKKVNQRVAKITDRLDKQSKSVDTLIYQIDNIIEVIATGTEESVPPTVDATSTSATGTLLDTVNTLKDKMYLLSTTTNKYVKGLKAIDTSKCESNQKLVKSQILASKPYYKDLLIADNDLKSYIKVDIRNLLLSLKSDDTENATNTVTYSKETKDNVGFWESVKSVFK